MEFKVKTKVGDNRINDDSTPGEPIIPKNVDPIEEPKEDELISEPEDVNNDQPRPDEPSIPIIAIDDKEYKLDDKGNALGEDGSIFMTKEDLDKLESSVDDSNEEEQLATIEDLEKLSGIELKDSEGKRLEFDLSLEGLAKREKYIKELGLHEGRQSAINNFFREHPDLYRAYIHKEKSGSLEGFSLKPTYSNIQLDKTNEAQLKNLIIEAEVKSGKTPEQAKRYADFCKAENILDSEGETAYNKLVATENDEIKGYEDSRIKSEQAKLEEEANYYGTYYDKTGKEIIIDNEGSIYNKIVTKGQFGNFVIPETGIKIKTAKGEIKTLTRRDIFDYVATPVNDKGESWADIQLNKRLSNVDYKLHQFIMTLTNNDVSQFLKKQVLESKSKDIKRHLSTGKKTTISTQKPNPANVKVKLPVPK